MGGQCGRLQLQGLLAAPCQAGCPNIVGQTTKVAGDRIDSGGGRNVEQDIATCAHVPCVCVELADLDSQAAGGLHDCASATVRRIVNLCFDIFRALSTDDNQFGKDRAGRLD